MKYLKVGYLYSRFVLCKYPILRENAVLKRTDSPFNQGAMKKLILQNRGSEMTVIRNLTPHAINICDAEGNVFATFAPEGTIARAQQTDVPVDTLQVDGHELPLVRTEFGAPVDLPEPKEEVWIVVSIITANAAKATGRPTDDLLITSNPVRDTDGRIIGARQFAVV